MKSLKSISTALDTAHDYITFQNQIYSPFHVVASLKASLDTAGFRALALSDSWDNLEAGGGYYVIPQEQKSLIAFIVGAAPAVEAGVHMVAAHTDSPCLRLKLKPILGSIKDDYALLSTEVYGGLILRSFLDRPLQLGGMLYERTYVGDHPSKGMQSMEGKGLPLFHEHLVHTPSAIAVIPDLAIHLDREKNAQGALNPELCLRAILSSGRPSKTESIDDSLARVLGLQNSSFSGLAGFELSLTSAYPSMLAGLHQEFIVGPRHDDLAMVFAAQQALLAVRESAKTPHKTALVAFFDTEECGSDNSAGAGSDLLKQILRRIVRGQGESAEDSFQRSMQASFLLSADMAHALHPLYKDKHDDNHRPVLNGGIVLKENANGRYATSGYSMAVIQALCSDLGIPLQMFVNRQDHSCGSTVGPMLATNLGCRTADIGIPMWAMHSSAETMGIAELPQSITLFKAFFLL